MRWMVLLLLVAGCTFSSPKGMADAPGDSSTDCEAWDTRGGHVKDLCAMAPAGSWLISSATATYDTESGTYSDGFSPRSFLVTQPGSRMLRVVSVDSFEVGQGASLRVVGPHPLLVLSWSTITVAGTIDVSSRAGSLGAGGSRQDCDAGDDGQGASEAGGGGGGGLNQVGKKGGDGNTAAGTANQGGLPGPLISRPVSMIVGGCRGGDGGGTGGQGGDGGGAIQLTARTSIAIASTGKLLAGGMGGAGAPGNGGGGGGGAGGHIGLDAPLVTTAGGASLAANGGGGGAGCQAGPGAAGGDGPITNVVATGGLGSSCLGGANGGNGGARGAAPVVGMDSNVSGGGGGGGAGFIIIWSPASGLITGVIVSPPEVHVPDLEMAP